MTEEKEWYLLTTFPSQEQMVYVFRKARTEADIHCTSIALMGRNFVKKSVFAL